MKKKLVLLCVAFVAVLSTLILSGVLTMSAEEVTEYSITIENDTGYGIYAYILQEDAGPEGVDVIERASEGTEIFISCNNAEKYVLAGIYVNDIYYESNEYQDAWFTMPAEDVVIVPEFIDTYTISLVDSETQDGLSNEFDLAKQVSDEWWAIGLWEDYAYAEAGASISISGGYYSGYGALGAYVNGGEFIEADENGEIYFTMPADDVMVELITFPKYSITCENNDIWFCITDDSDGFGEVSGCTAKPGAIIEVTRAHEVYDLFLVGIRINGGEIIEADEEGRVSFTMPAENIIIDPVFETGYSITFEEDAVVDLVAYRNGVGGASYAAEGDQIMVCAWNFGNTANYYILTAIRVNGGEPIEVDEDGYAYFTMPAEDVVISATVEEYREYIITDPDGNPIYAYFEYDGEWHGTQSAPEGITLRIDAENNVIGAYINDERVDADEDGYIYFTMPAEDVVVTPIYAEKYDFYINTEESGSFVANNSDGLNIFVENDGSYRGILEGSAFAGNTVSIYFSYDLVGAYIDGEKIDAVDGAIIFTMPEKNVEIILITDLYSISSSDDVDFYIYIAETDEYGIYAKEGQTIFVYYYGDSFVEGAYVNGEKVDADEDGVISFIMPAEDVEFELIISEKFYIDIEDSLENYEGIDWWVDERCLAPGQTVELHYELSAGIVGFTVNGEVVDFTIVENEYYYGITATFKMPAEDILIDALYDDTQYTITVDSDHGVCGIPSSALANEYIFILPEHVPGYSLSMTFNGVDYDEFTGGDPDGFFMPAEDLLIVITYTADSTDPEKITFEAEIDSLPSAGFGYDYTPDIKLSESVLTAIPDEMRDDIEIIWFASDEAFPKLTFDNYEEFLTLYSMVSQEISRFIDGYNYAGAFAITTDKNYVFASDVAIINGVEVPITVLCVDIGSDEFFGTIVFFEFELAELVENDVSLDLSVENLPSEGDSVYESEIDFELPIDADYVVEDFLWLYSPDGEFPEINSFEDFNSLEDFMVEYDAVFVSEGKYAILLLVSVDYGTNITDGTIILNGKIIRARVITQEELEASTMANGNFVYVLIEFEVSDDGAMVPAEILGDAPSGDEDEDDEQDNTENNPETGDRSYTSLCISILMAVMLLGAFVIVMSVKKSKRNRA